MIKKLLLSLFIFIPLLFVLTTTPAGAQGTFECRGGMGGCAVYGPSVSCDTAAGYIPNPTVCSGLTGGGCQGTYQCVGGSSQPGGSTPSSTDAGTWYNQSFQEWHTKVYNDTNSSEIFGERYTAAQVEWIIYSLIAFIMNHAGDPDVNGCLIKQGQDLATCGPAIIKAGQSLITSAESVSSNPLASAFNRPISAVEYFRDVANRLNPVSEVQAQEGFGFNAASPVLNLWRAARNLTYGLMVIAVIAMAFMIMFRVKISPQTVITVQSALPKIVIAIVLITFSYAIAGLLIDFMYVIIGVIAAALTGAGISDFTTGELFGALTSDRSAVSLTVYYFFTFIVASLAAVFSDIGILGLVTGFSNLMVILLILVALVVLLVAAIRIIWLLLRTYVMIILMVITGPFQILMGIFVPGAFGNWLKGILGHLAVYPVVGFMFLLAFVFLRGVFSSITAPVTGIRLEDVPGMDWLITNLMPFDIRGGFLGESTWDPPLTWGSNAAGLLYLGTSFVIVTLIPSAGNMIRGMIEGRPADLGTAIGQALGPITGPARFAGGVVGSGVSRAVGERIARRIGFGSETSSAEAETIAGGPPPPPSQRKILVANKRGSEQ